MTRSGAVFPNFFLQSFAGRNQNSKSVKASDTCCTVYMYIYIFSSLTFRTAVSVSLCFRRFIALKKMFPYIHAFCARFLLAT